MQALVIKDARIVNEGRTTEGDVLIAGGRIEQVGRGLTVPDGAGVLCCQG